MAENVKESKQSFVDQPQEVKLYKPEMTLVFAFGEQFNSEKPEGRVTLTQIEESAARLRSRLKARRGIF
jgi:hypothetical protein